jgi:hypothetical protein
MDLAPDPTLRVCSKTFRKDMHVINGDGWLSRERAAKLGDGDGGAKLVAQLLATAAVWVPISKTTKCAT